MTVTGTWQQSHLLLLLLSLNNLFVGGMVGLERTVLPLAPADPTENLVAVLPMLVIGFGTTKAILNLVVGALADRIGRRNLLLAGWLLAAPIPLLLGGGTGGSVAALPAVGANLLLGAHQALAWSMTLNMMMDLAPSRSRGFVAGLNEFAGYGGVALLALLTGLLAGDRLSLPTTFLGLGPFELGYLLVALGLGTALLVPETGRNGSGGRSRWVRGVGLPSLLGSATNLKDGLVWLGLPLLLMERGFGHLQTGLVTALYPGLWAVGQLAFGALSDRIGRRAPVAAGMFLQGAGLLALLPSSYRSALLAATLLGLGTGLAYPTLIACVSDRASAGTRATALGIYRFFRDGGYVLGAGVLLLTASPADGALLVGTGMVALAAVAWFGLADAGGSAA